MAGTEKNYTTMRITNTVKDKLEDLKIDNESLSNVIARLIEDNKQLRKDKDTLYKIALRTSNSIAFPNNIHRATFVIVRCLFDTGISEDDKLDDLKKYLNEMLSTDSTSVIDSIDNLKDMFVSDGEEIPGTLVKFESYVIENYR